MNGFQPCISNYVNLKVTKDADMGNSGEQTNWFRQSCFWVAAKCSASLYPRQQASERVFSTAGPVWIKL